MSIGKTRGRPIRRPPLAPRKADCKADFVVRRPGRRGLPAAMAVAACRRLAASSLRAKGRSIANLLELKQDENIAALIRIEAKTGPNKEDTTWQQPGFLFFATQQGTVKKTPLEDFANVRKGGIIAIGIEPGDALIEVRLTSGQDQVVLITREGMSIRFSEDDVRAMGRPAGGVRGISLEKTDAVVALAVVV